MDGRRSMMMARRSSSQVAFVGDIAYKASNGKIMVVAPDAWDASLGTAVGVVVIPSGFAPDNGKARIISLYWGTRSSTSSTTASVMKWSTGSIDTSLVNHTMVPITNSINSNITSNTSGYLPSDRFAGAVSDTDPEAKYSGSSSYIPSPYLGDKPNPAYYAPISGYNNALSDFDGKGNTDVLVALGTGYYAANAARNYKAAGAEEIEWYLPAMGELGYMLPRFNVIETALASVSTSKLDSSITFWSSTEFSSVYAYMARSDNGQIYYNSRANNASVRPFAMLDF
jgi:hypothetical protein